MKFIFDYEEKGIHKEFEIKSSDIAKKVTQIGVFSFLGKEVNRVRPPKRNIGLVINWMTAAALTDAVMTLIFPKDDAKKKEDDFVVSDESIFEEIRPENEAEHNE